MCDPKVCPPETSFDTATKEKDKKEKKKRKKASQFTCQVKKTIWTYILSPKYLGSVQFNMISMCSEKPIGDPFSPTES